METSQEPTSPSVQKQWFVLRDLRAWNAKTPAYKLLQGKGVEVFTPMQWVVRTSPDGKRTRSRVPYIHDLLFAYDSRAALDPILSATDKVQYRFRIGAGPGAVMTVPSEEMTTFITAIDTDPNPIYLKPSELTPEMIGREIIVIDGPLAGHRCRLLRLRGTRRRRLIVRLSDLIAATIEINPDFIQLV